MESGIPPTRRCSVFPTGRPSAGTSSSTPTTPTGVQHRHHHDHPEREATPRRVRRTSRSPWHGKTVGFSNSAPPAISTTAGVPAPATSSTRTPCPPTFTHRWRRISTGIFSPSESAATGRAIQSGSRLSIRVRPTPRRSPAASTTFQARQLRRPERRRQIRLRKPCAAALVRGEILNACKVFWVSKIPKTSICGGFFRNRPPHEAPSLQMRCGWRMTAARLRNAHFPLGRNSQLLSSCISNLSKSTASSPSRTRPCLNSPKA